MLKLLQSWERWLKSIVRDGDTYTVVSAFLRRGVVERITLRKDGEKEYASATKDEIKRIKNEQ